MNIDHIFIFTDDKGKIADELVTFGLTEGSNRIHVGQGTANRKFYFENFFLEILWVHDKVEIESEIIKSTGLCERAHFNSNDFSPFGLCIVNDVSTAQLFKDANSYQPNYFPKGMPIAILKNERNPSLPWTFQLPFKGQKKYENEPTIHKNGISVLTKASFEYKNNSTSNFLDHFRNNNSIEFNFTKRNWLTITFDEAKQGKKQDFDLLKLTIKY